MEMQRGLLTGLLLVVLVALLRTASSLPPDFFRNGRGDMMPQKRRSIENELVSASCTFCGFLSPNFELECRQDVATRRRDCVLAYVEKMEGYLSKRGWK